MTKKRNPEPYANSIEAPTYQSASFVSLLKAGDEVVLPAESHRTGLASIGVGATR